MTRPIYALNSTINYPPYSEAVRSQFRRLGVIDAYQVGAPQIAGTIKLDLDYIGSMLDLYVPDRFDGAIMLDNESWPGWWQILHTNPFAMSDRKSRKAAKAAIAQAIQTGIDALNYVRKRRPKACCVSFFDLPANQAISELHNSCDAFLPCWYDSWDAETNPVESESQVNEWRDDRYRFEMFSKIPIMPVLNSWHGPKWIDADELAKDFQTIRGCAGAFIYSTVAYNIAVNEWESRNIIQEEIAKTGLSEADFIDMDNLRTLETARKMLGDS